MMKIRLQTYALVVANERLKDNKSMISMTPQKIRKLVKAVFK